MADPSRPLQVKRLLIEVAEATGATEIQDAATNLIVGNSKHEEVRFDAMWFLVRHGDAEHLLKLAEPVGQASDDSGVDPRLRGMLVLELLKRKLWPTWKAALHAPCIDSELFDSRHTLLRRLADEMNLATACELLPHLRTLYERHSAVAARDGIDLPEFSRKAIELIASAPSSDQQNIDVVVGFAMNLLAGADDISDVYAVVNFVSTQLSNNVSARRCFYAYDITAVQAGNSGRRIGSYTLLKPEDWEWLRDQALTIWANLRQVWDDAYWIARAAHHAGKIADGDWDCFVTTVQQHAPGLPAEFEENVQRREKERREQEAAMREREGSPPEPLAECLQAVIESEMSDVDRMRELGYLCFSGLADGRDTNEWEQLSDELKNRVLDTCASGLATGNPIPIPAPTESFSGRILGEGVAFSRVIRSPRHADWLNEQRIQQWLPTGLFAGRSGGWPELIRTCWNVSVATTEITLIEMICDQARRGAKYLLLDQIPTECWTEFVEGKLIALLSEPAVLPEAKRELLQHLVPRCPSRIEPIVLDWASRPISGDDSDQLRRAGRDALLIQIPSSALDLIEADFAMRGAPAL
jgi:hypothetical protein